MSRRRAMTGIVLLTLTWLAIAGWQGWEHVRYRDRAQQSVLNRGREIAGTMGVVIRSQSRFGVIRQARLEDALQELLSSNDLQSVMLLNAGGRIVASAGEPVDLHLRDLPRQGVRWGERLATIVDLVDLGSAGQSDAATSAGLALMLREEDMPDPPEPRDGPGPRAGPPPGPLRFLPPPGPPGAPDGPDGQPSPGGPRAFAWPPGGPPVADLVTSEALAIVRGPVPLTTPYDQRGFRRAFRRDFDRRRAFRQAPMFMRPFWMNEERYQRLLAKQGLHGFILQLPLASYHEDLRRDLWIRLSTLGVAFLAVGGVGLAWRNIERMNRLQLRLLRASEMNAHLQELNVAAAGLAHETRNPLNIVRGQAQLILQRGELPGDVRQTAQRITEEVDRVTGRMNEFINYSRSPEPRLAPTRLLGVAREVLRALESDLADLEIECEVEGPDLVVEADESLLRQVIFNLLLNATQAVEHGGRIAIEAAAPGPRAAASEATLTIRDNGTGVPEAMRAEIFKPYFTTRAAGTGLGLSVVRQIVLAHRWEIEYVAGLDRGAGFRLAGLKLHNGGTA